jgi:hypothetical protein
MSEESAVIRGTCHCGAVKAEMHLTMPVADAVMRRCGCTFCRRIGALAFSDPAGHAVVDAKAEQLSVYHFGPEAADFLLCRTCGVFVAAISDDGNQLRCVVNVMGIAPDIAVGAQVTALQAADEDKSGRKARHAAKWTPVSLSDPAIIARLKTGPRPLQATGSL